MSHPTLADPRAAVSSDERGGRAAASFPPCRLSASRPSRTLTSPLDAYQQTLPHIRAHDADGQWWLLDPGRRRPELEAKPELAQHDPRQASLFGCPGVLRSPKPWVRGHAVAMPWEQLALRLYGIERHRGRTWSVRDHETLAALRAQTWRASDLGQRRLTIAVWMTADALVRPTDGEVVELGRNANERLMFQWLWAAYEAGAGGLMLTRCDWAAQLHCSPRSVYNYQRALERRGLAQLVQTWVPAPGGKGSQRGPILMRVGPAALELAGSEPAERRRIPGVDTGEALMLLVELRKRARRRLYHVSGAHYRHAQSRAMHASLNRQLLPNSPPLSGLPQSLAPGGAATAGCAREDAPPSIAADAASGGARDRGAGDFQPRTAAPTGHSAALGARDFPSPVACSGGAATQQTLALAIERAAAALGLELGGDHPSPRGERPPP